MYVYQNNSTERKMSDSVICFGPISVLPQYQRQGIGSLLINYSLELAVKLGFKIVLITGNVTFYKRFGFKTASDFGYYLKGNKKEERAEYFLVREISKGSLGELCGVYGFDDVFFMGEGKEFEEYEKRFPEKERKEKRETDIR